MERGPIVFITGTDTGVGKTLVTALLARSLSDQGIATEVIKPLESGCEEGEDGALLPRDGRLLHEAVNGKQAISDIVYHAFHPAISPHIVARREPGSVSIQAIKDRVLKRAEESDITLIEGAGGLLVPMLDGYSFCDFAKDLGAHVIVVAGSRLGVLNHAALTFEVLRRREIETFGYIVNHVVSPEEDVSTLSNRVELTAIAKEYEIEELAAIPYLPSASAAGRLENYSVLEHFALVSDVVAELISRFGLEPR